MLLHNRSSFIRSLMAVIVIGTVAFFGAAWRATPPPNCPIGDGGDLACARGFETRERAPGYSFRWSDDYAEIHLFGLGYGAYPAAMLRLRSGRPAGSEPVPARVGMNGRVLFEEAIPATDRHYVFLLPPRPLIGDVAKIQVASETWQPNPTSRSFGLVFQGASALIPEGYRFPPLLLTLGWAAILLSLALLPPNKALLWGIVVVGTLFVLLISTPLLAYFPWMAAAGGGAAILCRHTSQSPRCGPPLVWAGLLAAAYLPLIVWNIPAWGNIVGVVVCGIISVLAAISWHRLPWQRPASHPPTTSPTTSLRNILLPLITSAVLLRGVILLVRLISGHSWLDADVELFYSYGMALREIGLPEVEYPTGSLLVWAAMSWVSGDSRELFAILLAMTNIACDAVIVASLGVLAWRGKDAFQPPSASSSPPPSLLLFAPAAFYTFSPLLEVFVFGKYDPLPAALAIGALTLFATGRVGMAGAALAFGATIKWTPLLSLPFLVLFLLRQHEWKGMVRLVGSHIGVLALCSLPFALTSWETFLLPYQIQGGRGMNGESMWFLVAMLQDPSLLAHLDAPWGPLRASGLPLWLMMAGQIGVLALLGGIALYRPSRPLSIERTLTLAALAPAWFLLLNRVFSPQYFVAISAAFLAAFTIVRTSLSASASPSPSLSLSLRQTRGIGIIVVLSAIAAAQASNLLVWPFSLGGETWVIASTTRFICGVGVGGWLTVYAIRIAHCSSD